MSGTRKRSIIAFLLVMILIGTAAPMTSQASGVEEQTLAGYVGISGTVEVGSALLADLSGLTPVGIQESDLDFNWMMVSQSAPSGKSSSTKSKKTSASSSKITKSDSLNSGVRSSLNEALGAGTVGSTGAVSTRSVGTASTLTITKSMAGSTIYLEVSPKLGSAITGGKITSASVAIPALATPTPTAAPEENTSAPETPANEQRSPLRSSSRTKGEELRAQAEEEKEERIPETAGEERNMLKAEAWKINVTLRAASNNTVVISPGQRCPISFDATRDTDGTDVTKDAKWTTVNGTALPSGLSITNGEISGTVAEDAEERSYSVTIGAQYDDPATNDHYGLGTNATVTIIVKSAIDIDKQLKLPNAVAGEEYAPNPASQFSITSKTAKVKWSVEDVKTPGGGASISLSALNLQLDANTGVITATGRIPRQIAHGTYQITVKATRDPAIPVDPSIPTDIADEDTDTFDFTIEQRKYSLTASPSKLIINRFIPYESQTQEVDVINNGNVNLIIKANKARVEKAQETDPDLFSILTEFGNGSGSEITLKPGESAKLRFEIKVISTPGTYSAHLELGADDELGSDEVAETWADLAVELNVQERPLNSIAVSPTTLEPWNLQEGMTAVQFQTVTITNTGEEEISLNEPTGPREFTLGKLSKSALKPGEFATFTVTPNLNNLESGDYSGNITISTVATANNPSTTATVGVSLSVHGTDFASIVPVPSINNVVNGVEKSAGGLGLPETVSIKIADGNSTTTRDGVAVNWDVANSSYDPTDVNAHSFDVQGTITLPDDVTNPKDYSLQTQVRVSVNAYEPKIPNEADLSVNNVSDGGTYDLKTDITFTANMLGNQTNPRKGDVRYVPKSWKLGSGGSKSFTDGVYAGTLNVKKAGGQVLSVIFGQEVYNGEKWEAVDNNAVKSLSLNFQEGGSSGDDPSDPSGTPGDDNTSPSPSGGANGNNGTNGANGNNGTTGVNGVNGVNGINGTVAGAATTAGTVTPTPVQMASNIQNAVKTGDESNFLLWGAILTLTAAGAALAGFLLYRRQKS